MEQQAPHAWLEGLCAGTSITKLPALIARLPLGLPDNHAEVSKAVDLAVG